jgi:hypothetical protein
MKAMFKWVKATMDFSDVMVPLLFQRDIVEQGLQTAGMLAVRPASA